MPTSVWRAGTTDKAKIRAGFEASGIEFIEENGPARASDFANRDARDERSARETYPRTARAARAASDSSRPNRSPPR
jgi:hypothetical protein